MPEDEARRAIQAVYRIELPKLVARLARLTRDVGAAEELAQDALVAALEQWPRVGLPDNPGAWLMATARHHAINRRRRGQFAARTLGRLAWEAGPPQAPDVEGALDDDVGDDLLRLVFVACHPLLSTEARAALTLRLLGGLTTEEIARAFLVPEPTIAQRIVRAKRTLAEAGVPFEVPRKAERAARLASVLEVVYLIFNEGYAATAGEDLLRPALCEDALRLARVLAGIAPAEPEVHGLLALLEIQGSRAAARVDAAGAPVPLLAQDRSRWDGLAIERGLAALARAEALHGRDGPYALQAAIAACHARAKDAADTDWRRIAGLYEDLARAAPSPIVELNRAVAVGWAFGAEAGLLVVEALAHEPALAASYLLPAVRADLLEKVGRRAEARAGFEQAAELTQNASERAALLARAAKLGAQSE